MQQHLYKPPAGNFSSRVAKSLYSRRKSSVQEGRRMLAEGAGLLAAAVPFSEEAPALEPEEQTIRADETLYTTKAGVPLLIKGFRLSPSDLSLSVFTMRLHATGGVLFLQRAPSEEVCLSGNHTPEMTLTGGLEPLNAFLADGVNFQGPDIGLQVLTVSLEADAFQADKAVDIILQPDLDEMKESELPFLAAIQIPSSD